MANECLISFYEEEIRKHERAIAEIRKHIESLKNSPKGGVSPDKFSVKS